MSGIRVPRTLAWVLAVVVAASSCSVLGSDTEEAPVEAPTSAAVEEALVDSQFTRDGTFQSHLDVKGAKGMDMVLTLYPTKSTPRTNEWYPKGLKYFSFTFQAYDLSQKLRDPFETKRLVYLKRMKVTSDTVTIDGGKTKHPYKLDVEAAKATFDPEPVQTARGMLITSPKGAFELRNQPIKWMSLDTRGVILTFKATISVQAEAGGSKYLKRTIKQEVPIRIFESDEETEVAEIPINAN